jgi:hypothetical protein
VKLIRSFAFIGTTNTEFYFEEGSQLSTIEENAFVSSKICSMKLFLNLPSIEEITIPRDIKNIYPAMFWRCYHLQSLQIGQSTVLQKGILYLTNISVVYASSFQDVFYDTVIISRSFPNKNMVHWPKGVCRINSP